MTTPEKLFAAAYDSLVPDAGFFAPTAERGTRHYPLPELFDLLVWNVVVAFLVNLAATVAYGRIQPMAQEWKVRGKAVNEEGARKAIEAIIEKAKLPETQRPSDTDQISSTLDEILVDAGWPRELARTRAAALTEELLTELYESTSRI